MDKDHIAGAGKQAEGATKEAWGTLTGDALLKAQGQGERLVGKVQSSRPMVWLLGAGALLFIAILAFWH